MNVLRLFIGVFLALVSIVSGQIIEKQNFHYDFSENLVKTKMSVTLERDLNNFFQSRHESADVLSELDLSFFGEVFNSEALASGFRWHFSEDETVTLRSKLIYKYQPKHWPSGFQDLFYKAIFQPLAETFERSMAKIGVFGEN